MSEVERIVVVGDEVAESQTTPGARRVLRRHCKRSAARGAMLTVVVQVGVGSFHLLMGYGEGVAFAAAMLAGSLVGLILWWQSRRVQ